MHTNLSKHTSCFSDFQWPEDTPLFPTATQVGKYLAAYCHRFLDSGVLSLGCKVTSAERSATKAKWVITWIVDEKEEKCEFDFLIIACGFFSEPYIPPIPGLETFTGTISHSSSYSSPDEFKGKNIAIVGGSLSSVEIVDDIATHAASIHHIIPRPFWILPKHLPLDVKNPGTTFLPLDLVLYRLSRQSQEDIPPVERWRKTNKYLSSLGGDLSSISRSMKVDTDMPPYAVVSDTYANYVRSGQVTIHSGHLTSVAGSRLILSSESSSLPENITHIIFATGFRPSASANILPSDILSSLAFDPNDHWLPVTLHRATLHPSLPNAAFVGHYRGPYWGIIELQALWCAGIFSGTLPFPSIEEMEQGVAHEKRLREAKPRMQWPRGDYVNFGTEFTKTLGISMTSLQSQHNTLVSAQDVFGPHHFERPSWLHGRMETQESQSLKSSLEETLYASATAGKFVAAAVFRALQGKWVLNRTYLSRRPEYPSGPSVGIAEFIPRIVGESKDTRREYLYSEKTELTASNGIKLNGTQQYIYQYDDLTDKFEVFFCKRDEKFTLDYFFHSLKFVPHEGQTEWRAEASHFCSPDNYEVGYTFYFKGADLERWKIEYDVKGPRKDYNMETWYTRP